MRFSDSGACVLLNETIQRKLFTVKDLIFKHAVELGTAMETTAKDVIELHGRAPMETEINRLSNVQQKTHCSLMCGIGVEKDLTPELIAGLKKCY